MTDKLIRELIVDVKQKGASRTAKSIQEVANALQDAASGAELTNEQLQKIPNSLALIERSAQRAAQSINKIGPNKGMTQIQKTLSSIEEYMDLLVSSVTHMTESMQRGFKASADSADRMGNEIAAAIEKSEDQLIGLNGALGKNSKAFSQTENAAGRAARAIGNTSGSSRGATRDFAAMAKIGGSLPIMYAAIASNVFVLGAAFEQLRSGDQLNRLMDFGTIVGASSGTPVQNLAKALQEATNYAVSFEEAMRQASTASAYGFDTKQIAQFGLVARRAAAVLGIDMTDALNRVIKGVSKQEIELLDELGVTIRLNDAYAAYVKVLNSANTGIQYNTQNLTTFQKQQAYANAVVAQSTKNFGLLDSVLRATPWEAFAASADSAMRKLQMSSAKFLEPVIARFNSIIAMSKTESIGNQVTAQDETNAKIDPKNATAMGQALENTRQNLADIRKIRNETSDLLTDVNVQIGQLEKRKGNISLFDQLVPTSGNEKVRQEFNDIDTQLQAAYTKRNLLMKEGQSYAYAYSKAEKSLADQTERTAKAYPQLVKQSQTGKLVPDVTNLERFNEANKEFTNNVKNVAPDAMSAFNDPSAIKNVQTSAAAFKEIANNIKQVSTATGESMDSLAKKAGVGVDTYAELEKRVATMGTYTKAIGQEESNNLAIEKARNDVLKNGGTSKAADIAAEKVRTSQLDDQIAATKQMLALNSQNPTLQNQLAKLETEKLQSQNSQYKNATKIKDVSDKIVGIEEQIALTKDSTLDKDQYTLANLKLQLDTERQRQKILEGNAAKLKDYMQSKLEEAKIERQLREEQYSQQVEAAQRERDQITNMREASGELGTQEQIVASIADKQREIADLRKAAKDNNVAEDRTTITNLQNQIEVLKKQSQTATTTQNKGYQDSATGLLGGTYQSTQGMSPEQKTAQEFQNNQDGYAQSIANLQAINSEATNAGQSIGNLVNAMMQYSQGSLDFSSVAAAGMQTIGQFISMGANQQISAIDAAISAEQARDGQSEESKNKIKKLEAEKVKIQQNSAKQQILISTATAIMQAATSVPYPYSIPLMIAAAAAGAMSYSQASNPNSASLSGLDSGSSTTTALTLGERQKNVDVSQQANAGELSYVRGESGTGNANTFIPRAEGGNMVPGVSYAVGENGIEVITPQVPSKVTPADQVGAGSSGGSGRPIAIHVNTMDAKSFRDFLMDNGSGLRDALESTLNEEGTSLKRLK